MADSENVLNLTTMQHFGAPAKPYLDFYQVISNPPRTLSKIGALRFDGKIQRGPGKSGCLHQDNGSECCWHENR
eukprot:UN10686